MKLEASATPTATRDGGAEVVRRAEESWRELARKRRRGWAKI